MCLIFMLKTSKVTHGSKLRQSTLMKYHIKVNFKTSFLTELKKLENISKERED